MSEQLKIKHLEFIQNVISRLSTNSFLIKGWCITLITGLIALSLDNQKFVILIIGLPIIVIFWFLDTYYLWLEKIYRAHYTIEIENHQINFNMDITSLKKEILFSPLLFRFSIFLLYLILIILLIGAYLFLRNS
ncbi:hypothetical protein [Aequorivita marisscotiae]|uniref:Uncharacterized protein n=1 Tax=Aequorivita marisscotiae TaxID=3040348 RepID=A0ABY8KXV0_9FLAO|nr:hypothetical protein [Aequorivita sp. Ant34-E75]WGF92646.1 hypothetical protein QCQ61_00295 [Aequorivita sp. Ant34-E75]